MNGQTAGTNMQVFKVTLAGVVAVLGVVTAAPAQTGTGTRDARHRVAVEPFEWAAVTDPVQKIFGTHVDVGKGFQSLIVNRLADGGKVRVMERGQLGKVLDEQDRGSSSRGEREAKGRIGHVLGVDALLVGEIVTFGRDDKKKGGGGVAVGVGPLPIGIGGIFGSKDEKAVVVVTYRIVDAETAEILASGQARGESSRKSKNLGGVVLGSGGLGAGGIDMASANFQKTIIGEATIAAADKLAEAVNAKASSLPRREVDIEADVAAASADSVTLAKGLEDGIEIGDRFDVFQLGPEIKHPRTGEVLARDEVKVGEMVVTSVRPRIATGSYRGSPVTPADGLARKVRP